MNGCYWDVQICCPQLKCHTRASTSCDMSTSWNSYLQLCVICIMSFHCCCFVCQLPADEAADNSDSSRCTTCEHSAVTDQCAISVINGVIHRPSTLHDKCCADEVRTCSSSSHVSNDCTFQGSDASPGTAGACSALTSSSSQVESPRPVRTYKNDQDCLFLPRNAMHPQY